jgi:hypothetical protein
MSTKKSTAAAAAAAAATTAAATPSPVDPAQVGAQTRMAAMRRMRAIGAVAQTRCWDAAASEFLLFS